MFLFLNASAFFDEFGCVCLFLWCAWDQVNDSPSPKKSMQNILVKGSCEEVKRVVQICLDTLMEN